MKSIGKTYTILMFIIIFRIEKPEIGGHPSFLDLKTGKCRFSHSQILDGSTSHKSLCSEEEM